MVSVLKIGLMGGTFDPPHKAHIKMAEAAIEQYSLDKAIFMTGGNPPHKTTQTDAGIRHHMMRLAIVGKTEFEACDYEIKKEGYSYTSDTLRYLNENYPNDTFYFIIGGDSLKAIFTWHEPREILKRCVILVYPRDGYPTKKDIAEFNAENNSDVCLLDIPEYPVSSTDIRHMAERDEDFSEYTGKDVYEYIKRNGLYKKSDETQEEHLKRLLKPDRYIHSLGVASEAVKLAGIYGADAKKAYIAGLLHDCAKNLSPEETKIKCIDLDVELDEYEKAQPGLVHAKVGAEFVKTEFGINDEEICSAIRWHTIGRVNMTLLEKIIFVADMVEPNRDYVSVEHLRRAAHTNIDTAVLECVIATIKFNTDRGRVVHPNAYKIRDWLLSEGVGRLL